MRYYFLLCVMILGACSAPMGKRDVGQAGLHGPVKSVQYLNYGREYTEELAKRLFNEATPVKEEYAEYDKYGRVLKEVFKDEHGTFHHRNYAYGNYLVEGTDASYPNVLLNISIDGRVVNYFHYNDQGICTRKDLGKRNGKTDIDMVKALYFYKDRLLNIVVDYSSPGWGFGATYEYEYDKNDYLKQITNRDSRGSVGKVIKLKKGKIKSIEYPEQSKVKYNDVEGIRPDKYDATERLQFVGNVDGANYLEFDKYGNWIKKIQKHREGREEFYFEAEMREIIYEEK